MTEKIRVMLTDEWALGCGILTEERPRGCPGLGGWKKDNLMWFTRVKGETATRLLRERALGLFEEITLELDGDKIVW